MASARTLHFLRSALLFSLATSACQALQLGESEAQTTARHGTPAVEDHGRRLAMYFWTGWSAQVEFKDAAVSRLTYRRSGALTDAEIQSLLQANGGVERWTETTSRGSKVRQWHRADGARAECAAGQPVSIVFQGGRALTPSEAILNESFLKFSAADPASPSATTSEAQTREPTVLSNATPEPAAKFPTAAASPVQAPQTAAAPVPPAFRAAPPSPPTLPEPPVATASPSQAFAGLPGLLIFLFASVAGIIFFVKMLGSKKAAPAIRQVEPAPAEPAPTPAPTAAGPDLAALRWDQFELLVGEIFRRKGYLVELSAALGADGGVDLMLRRDGECIPVQCKHWKTAKVAAREMREFYGTMTDAAAPRGIFVTTGSFTRDARDFATGKAIELLDGPALETAITAVRRPEENLFDVASWIDDFAATVRIFDPECPFCRGAMTLRQNRSSGAHFWGCATYPRCTGKRDPRTDLLTASAA